MAGPPARNRQCRPSRGVVADGGAGAKKPVSRTGLGPSHVDQFHSPPTVTTMALSPGQLLGDRTVNDVVNEPLRPLAMALTRSYATPAEVAPVDRFPLV